MLSSPPLSIPVPRNVFLSDLTYASLCLLCIHPQPDQTSSANCLQRLGGITSQMLFSSPKADWFLHLTLSAFSLSLRPYPVPSVLGWKDISLLMLINLIPSPGTTNLFQSSVYMSISICPFPKLFYFPTTGGKQPSLSLSLTSILVTTGHLFGPRFIG